MSNLEVFLTIFINFHKPMSVQCLFSIAGVFAVAHLGFDVKFRRIISSSQLNSP
jgi:hypothetical protein